LIELLVVIAIIGLLSTLSILALNGAREKAKIARAKVEISQFIKAATIAQGETGKPLLNITGSGCSCCVCTGDLRDIDASSTCYTSWLNAINKIQIATGGIVLGLNKMVRDPWGSPYQLDENEKEGGSCANYDLIISAGPDGVRSTADDIRDTVPWIICPN
jgi:type II secretory pathway pseudopilin PulG